jgi:hypothetical protein
MSSRREELVGQIFGRLTVCTLDTGNKNKDTRWLCVCECGTFKSIRALTLKNGKSKSCGCMIAKLASERESTHRLTKTMEYRSWTSMLQRCNNKNHIAFNNYGGRGISVCERWQKSFLNFLNDMGPRPSIEYSIERIDNNGNYEPKNSKWATEQEQKLNRRDSRIINHNGLSKNLSVWASEYNIPFDVLSKRLAAGWDMGRALTQPRRVTAPRSKTPLACQQ